MNFIKKKLKSLELENKLKHLINKINNYDIINITYFLTYNLKFGFYRFIFFIQYLFEIKFNILHHIINLGPVLDIDLPHLGLRLYRMKVW